MINSIFYCYNDMKSSEEHIVKGCDNRSNYLTHSQRRGDVIRCNEIGVYIAAGAMSNIAMIHVRCASIKGLLLGRAAKVHRP